VISDPQTASNPISTQAFTVIEKAVKTKVADLNDLRHHRVEI